MKPKNWPRQNPLKHVEPDLRRRFEKLLQDYQDRSADQIAQLFRSVGIQGSHGPASCPMAVAFSKAGCPVRIERILIMTQDGSGGLEHRGGVRDFVRRFGEGEWPDLCHLFAKRMVYPKSLECTHWRLHGRE